MKNFHPGGRAPALFAPMKILKMKLRLKFTMENDLTADFWEMLPGETRSSTFSTDNSLQITPCMYTHIHRHRHGHSHTHIHANMILSLCVYCYYAYTVILYIYIYVYMCVWLCPCLCLCLCLRVCVCTYRVWSARHHWSKLFVCTYCLYVHTVMMYILLLYMLLSRLYRYKVASISRLLKIKGLFCKRAP